MPFFLQLGFGYTVNFPVAEFDEHKNSSSLIIAFISLLSLFCYSCAALWRLRQHSKEVVNHFSALSGRITLKWLNYITIAFVVSYILPVIGPLTGLSALLYSHAMAFTLYIFVLSFYGLKQTAIFTESEDPLIEERHLTELPKKEQAIKEKLLAESRLISDTLTPLVNADEEENEEEEEKKSPVNMSDLV